MKSSYSKIQNRIAYSQSLSASDIQAIKSWHKSKMKNLLNLIINTPGLQTHVLQQLSYVNNIPNCVAHINQKLRGLRYEVECVPDGTNRQQSYKWYLLNLTKV